MNWEPVVQKITPYIFKIETPAGHGTGFLYLYNDNKSWCGVATALHVVDYANTWKQPIRLTHQSSSEQIFLKDSEYIIITDWKTDSAVILFQKPTFELPSELIELIPLDMPLSIGNEVSWIGFPAIEPYTLCFFSGNISAWQDFRKAYLIDGVAINGVSGGPVAFLHATDGVRIVGIVSAYRANRATGETLPGLLYAQDVSHFHGVLHQIRSIDDANRKKLEIEQQQQTDKNIAQQSTPQDAA
ncbi:MAG: serine protease [Nitrospirota bacterium]